MSGADELARFAQDIATEADAVNHRIERAVGRTTDYVHGLAKMSAPRDTGELAGSIQKDTSGMGRRVWSDAPQGFFLEFGTSKMAPQPWLLVHEGEAERHLRSQIDREQWDAR